MADSDFKTISQVTASFDLNRSQVNLFSEIEGVEPSEYLKITLKRNLKVAFDNDTEKARSEFIIAPLLITELVIENAEDINVSKILAILTQPIQRFNLC